MALKKRVNLRKTKRKGQHFSRCHLLCYSVAADHYYVTDTCTCKVPPLPFSHHSIFGHSIRY